VVTDERVRFSIFDWLDESGGRGTGDTYVERLRMLELADRSGFYAYHLAEHHATELSTVPSPNLFLSAVAQRTTRLRLGALSYVVPTYEPMRLLEEVCMLDQLANGRLDLGLSRGSSGEHVENDPDKARDMLNEAVDVILMGLSTGQVDYHGRHYTYDQAFTRLRPKQRPYPPLWYPTSNVKSIAWVAANGISTAFSVRLSSGGLDQVAAMVQRYWTEYRAHVGDAGRLNAHVDRPNVGLSVHVHVAETDAQARAQAEPAYARFMHNYSYRYVRRGQPDRYAARRQFADELEHGGFVVGSPATVREQLARYLDQTGANYVMGAFAFGDMPVEQVLGSVDLFGREVIPALSERGQPAASR
jgi:alkanesulfonate monooxygenase SsuD/methylene tetrahydromethanopterin reductase-like flavin-dependent oxidoreductase (luciferase family)